MALLLVVLLAGCSAAGADSSATPSAAASTSLAAQPTGSVDDVVPDEPLAPSAAAVTVGQTVDVADGVAVRVSQAEPVEGVAALPGEVSGPAVRFEVVVTNSGGVPLPLDEATVTAFGSDGSPAPLTSQASVTPLSGTVAPGATADGSYVVSLPVALRSPMTVQVSLSATTTTAVVVDTVP